MARRLALVLSFAAAVMVFMVQLGQPAAASRTSPAEAFWRAALPAAAMPDAILELLHHGETDVPSGVIKDDDDDPPSPAPPVSFSYGEYKALPARSNAADDAVVGWSPAVFFLEDAVRVGGSLPFRGSPPMAAAAAAVPLRLYTIRSVSAVEGSSFVVCRGEDGGATYGCRSTGPARAYLVDLAGDDDNTAAPMTAAAVCHADTSRWDPEHAAFRLLGVKPGGPAVCHAVPDARVLPAKNDKGATA